MVIPFAVSLGLVAQAPAFSARAPDPIRVSLTDTTAAAGAHARVHVHLAGAAHLTVLHVDPEGRIRVLFPRRPDDRAWVPGRATFEVAVDGEGGTGTILAARSRWPFRLEELKADGGGWDYERALLFQPTAGDPLAALLDITDRMTGGRPYAFDVVTHRTGGTVAARDPQLVTPVCLTCVRSRRAADNPAITLTQASTVISHANTVDCSGTVLVNSSCGVIDRRVSTTIVYESAPPPATTPVYVPYYVPVFVPLGRQRPPPSSSGSAVERVGGRGRAAVGPSRDLVPSREFLHEIRPRPR